MSPLHDPNSARNTTLVLTIAAVAVAGWLALKARRARRRATEGPAPPTSLPRPARSASGWFWVLILGAGVAIGWTQSGGRRGSAGLVALAGLAAVVPVLWIGGQVAWRAAAFRLAYRASRRAERRAARGDVDGAIAGLRASVERRQRRATHAEAGDAWAPPPSVVGRDPVLAIDLGTLGHLEGIRGDWAAALGHFRAAEAVAEGMQVAQARVAQGDALFRLGRREEGVDLMRAAVAAAPPDDPEGRSQLGLHLAAALIELGRPDEAGAALDAAVADWGRAATLHPGGREAGAAEIAAIRDQIAAARGDRGVGRDGATAAPVASPGSPR